MVTKVSSTPSGLLRKDSGRGQDQDLLGIQLPLFFIPEKSLLTVQQNIDIIFDYLFGSNFPQIFPVDLSKLFTIDKNYYFSITYFQWSSLPEASIPT
jgi:hypothetical protein